MPSTESPSAVLLNLSHAGVCPPSLASGTLAAWAMTDPELRGKVAVRYCDAAMDEPADEVAERAARGRPRLAGFSCYVWNVRESLAAAAALKRRLPGCMVLLGGPEAGGLAAEILAAHPAVDYVAVGEGEETFRLLLRALVLGNGRPEDVPGLALREGAAVRKTPEPPLVDLGKMPSPYLEGRIEVPDKCPFMILETSRGCPFACSYCDWGPRKMRYYAPAHVEADFRYALDRCSYVATNDADILMERGRAKDLMSTFLRAAGKRPGVLGIETNPVHLLPEIVDIVAKAPERFYFAFGLQSIDPAVNKLMDRPFNLEAIEARLDYFRKRCPATPFHFSLIFGLPGDTLEGFRRSVDWSLRWRPTRVALNQCLALPGSRLYSDAAKLGLEFQREAPHNVLSTPMMSPEDLRLARRLASLVTFVFALPPVRERLVDLPGGPSTEAFERWSEFVASKGLDLEKNQPFDAMSDSFPWSPGDRAAAALRADPLELAALLDATRRFAESQKGLKDRRKPAILRAGRPRAA